MHAFEEALAATSRPWAPWYAIPADSKRYMRMAVAEIVVDTLKSLPLKYPEGEDMSHEETETFRNRLTASTP